MKGVPPVARMGTSLGADNYNSDWQMYNQGWGDNFYGMWGGNMGRNSPRGNMMKYPGNPGNFSFGNNSPRSYGDYSGAGGNYSGRPGSPGPGGRMGPNGSPYNSPR